MKETLSGAIIATVIFFFAGLFVFAKWGPGIPLSVTQITTNKNDLFTVSAEGKATAKPDIAQINLGFTASGQSVSTVQSQANAVMNKIIAGVKGLGIAEKDIQTTNYSLRPDYDWKEGRQSIRGYVADVNIFVKVRDFEKINSVIDSATTNGANQVGNLSFTVDDPEKFKSLARKEAIAKAKSKAQEIANESGINLGRLVNVTEGYNSPIVPMYAKAEMAPIAGGGDSSTRIEPGSSEVSISVTLSYETR